MLATALLGELNGPCAVLHPKLYEITGTVNAALMLRHLLFLHSVQPNAEFVAQSATQFSHVMCTSRKLVEQAKDVLICNGFVDLRYGAGNVCLYRVDFETVTDALASPNPVKVASRSARWVDEQVHKAAARSASLAAQKAGPLLPLDTTPKPIQLCPQVATDVSIGGNQLRPLVATDASIGHIHYTEELKTLSCPNSADQAAQEFAPNPHSEPESVPPIGADFFGAAAPTEPPKPPKTKPPKKPKVIPEYTEEFLGWIKAYPRKDAKADALKAYKSAITGLVKGGLSDVAAGLTLLSAATSYAQQRKGQEQRFTPLPASWLRGERWNDEPAAVVPWHQAGANASSTQGW
jgi:hypothetical protein